jgi:hypothetical protein
VILLAGLITSAINRELHTKLQIVALYEYSTIRGLATHLQDQLGPPADSFCKVGSTDSCDSQKDPLTGAQGAAKRQRCFPARAPSEQLADKLYATGSTSSPFFAYCFLQYVLSTLLWFVVPGCFSLTAFGLLVALAHLEQLASFLAFPLLMMVYPVVLLAVTLVMIMLKWVLIGRVTSGEAIFKL